MGKERRKTGKPGKQAVRGHPAEQSGARDAPPTKGRRRRAGRRRRKRPVLRFVVLFAVFMGVFQLACATSFMKDTVFPSYLRLNAQMSGAMLSVFEDSLTVSGHSIRSPRYSLTIERGCDAIEPSALFLAGVLAFPAATLSKLPGMLIGTFCLMVLNLVRIVTLFYVGVYRPTWFHVMHVDVWQALFIFLAILFWVLWALWATQERVPKPDAVAKAS